MKVFIFGGTGFIGTALAELLAGKGYEVFIMSRHALKGAGLFDRKISIIQWDSNHADILMQHFTGDYLIINLAGASIGPLPWTQKRKKQILNSRVKTTASISEAVNRSAEKPAVILQGSAIGYYGSPGDEKVVETSFKGSGFMAEIVDRWEKALTLHESQSSRIVFFRTSVVLGKGGGILPLMALPFKLFFGGYHGQGNRWFSWIHLQDEVEAIKFLLENPKAEGVFNLTAPNPVQVKHFAKSLAKIMNRPSWFHLPGSLLRLLLGQMADELLLSSQRIIPSKLLELGYRYKFPDLYSALENIYHDME